MGDQDQQHKNQPNNDSDSQKTEPVRSRWTPKSEQILILETIFNSGMVNPPKEETVRIRKLLEKFGTVGDANVFYWFQNRRSRSRRRQRQIQASLNISGQAQTQLSRNNNMHSTGAIPVENNFLFGFTAPAPATIPSPSSICSLVGSSSSCGIGHDGGTGKNLPYLSSICQQQIGENSIFRPLKIRNSLNQYGIITVFINGVATEVQRGPLDARAMFGEDVMLFHSSGLPIAVNGYGILLEPLQHGESYFLVPRQT